MRDHVPGAQRLATFRQLATTVLLTYALRNADCHAKNLALLYTSRANAHLSPAYDMLTTSVYAGFQHNPPAIDFMGKRTWAPGKNLQKFIAATFGIQPKEQQHMVQAISDAVADVAPQVRQAMAQHPGFEDLGKRMLMDNGWFRTVARDDVTLVTGGIRCITERGIVTDKGVEHEVDIIIIATGFDAVNMLSSFNLQGRGGQSIREAWAENGAQAFYGVAMPGFPNFFAFAGPNTALGHGGKGSIDERKAAVQVVDQTGIVRCEHGVLRLACGRNALPGVWCAQQSAWHRSA